jgi:ABC-type bacteriocin/lantibiotic exporter with double-glycine peptidase domain
MERVQDIMEYPPDIIPEKLDSGVVYEKLRGDIELRNVTFGYSRLDPPLIENLSLHILPGQKIAFVGASGCGKSTLTKLISGLYQPWSGEVLLDGKPLQEISRSVLTGSVAVVEQGHHAVRRFHRRQHPDVGQNHRNFDVILAARDADIHEDIMRRTGGYEYRLSEGGRNFSGGQRQRLEIARVLAQDPTIIIMDEATSALDAKTEYDVVRKIQDRGITEIVIAHRLSTIRDCDIIYMMDRGVITEQGTHEELFAKGGLYTQLISSE